VDIFIRSRPGVDPYYRLLMADPLVGWWKVWFFLWNDANVPLPVFTGSHPSPQPKWGYMVWPRKTSIGYKPSVTSSSGCYEVGSWVQTFVRCHIQPLHQWEMTMWMYPGPSCPNRPFNVELYVTEISTQIQGVLAHRANQIFCSGPVPLREGVNSPWVGLLELPFVCLCQFLCFQCVHIIMQDLGYTHSAS
jgi:hypothetical protein